MQTRRNPYRFVDSYDFGNTSNHNIAAGYNCDKNNKKVGFRILTQMPPGMETSS